MEVSGFCVDTYKGLYFDDDNQTQIIIVVSRVSKSVVISKSTTSSSMSFSILANQIREILSRDCIIDYKSQ